LDNDEEESDEDDNDEKSKYSKNNASFNTFEDENNLKINDGDRDSASNRAIAGSSMNIDCSNLKLANFNSNQNNGSQSNKLDRADLKSNYTINSYEKNVLSMTNDADTLSVSMLSEKSMNPSVVPLTGSIK
jgi:hypothetical protein